MRTQVGIVGAGPAGLILAHLLHLQGIESVLLEQRSRAYVERRVRAGVLEQGTVDLLCAMGVGERLRREGIVHHGIELRFAGQAHRIAMSELTGGRAITIYGQQKVVNDLFNARLSYSGPLFFKATDVAVHDVDTTRPRITFNHEGRAHELECDVIAGCDGFHGVCRDSMPAGRSRVYQREYPFGWLGILAEVAPSTDELIYARHERGFALHSLRSAKLSRLYIQVDPDEQLDAWPDERVWAELHQRFAMDGWHLQEGPVIDKGITPVRAFVIEPMQYGRLFLAGDAAHIVPPTGAKGLNLAAHDVKVLADALVAWYRTGTTDGLDAYSNTCLRRVWRAQEFAHYMTMLVHRLGDDPFAERLQTARLEQVCSSAAAARLLAENYAGLPMP